MFNSKLNEKIDALITITNTLREGVRDLRQENDILRDKVKSLMESRTRILSHMGLVEYTYPAQKPYTVLEKASQHEV